LAGAQLPSAVVLPASLMVSPYAVDSSALNVTATEVAVVQDADVELATDDVVRPGCPVLVFIV